MNAVWDSEKLGHYKVAIFGGWHELPVEHRIEFAITDNKTLQFQITRYLLSELKIEQESFAAMRGETFREYSTTLLKENLVFPRTFAHTF